VEQLYGRKLHNSVCINRTGMARMGLNTEFWWGNHFESGDLQDQRGMRYVCYVVGR